MDVNSFSLEERIMILAAIRRTIAENFPDGVYFDVIERVLMTTSNGQYNQWCAVVIVHSEEQKEYIQQLQKTGMSVAVIHI